MFFFFFKYMCLQKSLKRQMGCYLFLHASGLDGWAQTGNPLTENYAVTVLVCVCVWGGCFETCFLGFLWFSSTVDESFNIQWREKKKMKKKKEASGPTSDVSDVNMPNHWPISPPVRISVTEGRGTAGNLMEPRLEINSNYYVKVNFITL